MPPDSMDQKKSAGLRRRLVTACKRPSVWFRFVIAAFSFNLFIAIVTVERHISSSTTTFRSSPQRMDRHRISPPRAQWSIQMGSPKGEFSTESRIWHRMLQQQQQKLEGMKSHLLCSKNGKNQTSVTKHHGDMEPLSPFGFSESVQAYVYEHENMTSTSKHALSTQSMYCLAPPSEPSCRSLQYTVVIYSSASARNHDSKVGTNMNENGYWRNIVVGTMKFLAYPSVERVNLVLRRCNNKKRRNHLEDAAKKNRYAKRILDWSRKGFVQVIMAPSLWDAIDRLEVPSEGTLWIDGDYSIGSHSKIANDTVFNHRFRTWKDVPNSLVLPNESSLFSLSSLQINQEEKQGSDDDSFCSFPVLHEMMMHKNYLCYLNHPVVGASLRNYTASISENNGAIDGTKDDCYNDEISWEITTMAMGMLLFSVGDGYVIEDADQSSAFNSNSPSSRLLDSSAGGNETLMSYMEKISNYFGCPCSTAIHRWFPSNSRQCLGD